MLVDVIAHNYDCENASAACRQNYVGDACHCFTADFLKLWNRFKHEDSSGVVGAIIVVILYIATFTVSCFLLYEYLMHVHKDARILDLWRRITADEEEFLIPHDFEISYEELLRICGERMSKWRGLDGSSRKLEVTEYVEGDESDPTFENRTMHYAIYEHAPDGHRKKLYRHFLMLPEGAIVEVFDKYQSKGKDKVALLQQQQPVTNQEEEPLIDANILRSYRRSMKSVK
jgi:hypothetical protein